MSRWSLSIPLIHAAMSPQPFLWTSSQDSWSLPGGYWNPRLNSFFPARLERCILKKELAAVIRQRKTFVYAIVFATPPHIPEVVVPQLKRSLLSLRELLEREGFAVHHADFDMQPARCMFLFELLTGELPAVRRHAGPPLWNRVNADRFRTKHLAEQPAGPFITEGRYEMELPREFTTAKALLSSPEILSAASLGKHVRQSLECGWTLFEGEECWQEDFAPFIAAFFDRSSPFVRILRKR